MKTETKPFFRAEFHLASGFLFAGAVMLAAGNAPAQNLFVAGSGYDGNIYEIAPGGSPTTYAENQAGPSGLAFDHSGNLFVTDTTGGNIFEFTPGGSESTFASGLSQMEGGIAIDGAGNLFVTSGTDILKFTPGKVESIFATGLSNPGGLAFDTAGNLFEADTGSGNINEFAPNGTPGTFAYGLSYPVGLAFDSHGNLFTTEFLDGNIDEFTPGGTEIAFSGGWLYPQALAFNASGSLYLFQGSYQDSSVIAFTPDGTGNTTVASGFIVPTTDGLAFDGVTLPVPEPSTIGLLAVGTLALLVPLRRKIWIGRDSKAPSSK